MKLVLFETGATHDAVPGLLTDRGVVSIADAVRQGHTPQLTMQGIIDDFETLRPALERLGREGLAAPVDRVRLRAPLPRPGKILACIATADEIPEPNDVHIQFWVDGQLRHNYNTDDMEHPVPALVEFASTIMTLNSGDVIACGTNHEGLGPLQDGEVVD